MGDRGNWGGVLSPGFEPEFDDQTSLFLPYIILIPFFCFPFGRAESHNGHGFTESLREYILATGLVC
jgi:hypothetical protein